MILQAWLLKFCIPIIAVLCGACLILTAAIKWKSDQLESTRKDNVYLKEQRDVAVNSNESIFKALADLKAKHTELMALISTDTSAIRASAERLDLVSDDIRKRAIQLRTTREEMFRATPSCEELARLDIAGMCPSLAASLRESSGGQRSDHSRGGEAGSGTPGQTPH